MLDLLLKRKDQLIKEIEEHYNMRALEVAEDKKLSKEEFFKTRDKELNEIESEIRTELF